MDFAVIKTGGKQYLVNSGLSLKVEKLDAEVGSTVTFSEVLAISQSGKLAVGKPNTGDSIQAEVVEHKKTKKVFGSRYKNKTRAMKGVFGHRQTLTTIKIK